MDTLTAEAARAALSYDPATGEFRWRVNVSATGRAGNIAGCVRKDGRRVLRLGGKLYLAYRVAFLIQTGSWPSHEVDHTDGNPGNDAWANLRQATRGQNARNTRTRHDNVLRRKGISPHKQTGKIQASITADGQTHNLGLHDTPEQAHAAYREAAKRLHGEFARPSTLEPVT